MSPVLTREQLEELKELDDRHSELVPVPEWKLDVWIHGLSGTDRDDFDLAMLDQKKDRRGRVVSQEINMRNLRAKLIARCARESDDSNSNLVFSPQDVDWLGRKSGAALQRLYAVAMRLSGLSEEDVEEMSQELGKDQSGDSGTGSLLPSGSQISDGSNSVSAATSSPAGLHSIASSPSGTDA